jgi:hypothetical protein
VFCVDLLMLKQGCSVLTGLSADQDAQQAAAKDKPAQLMRKQQPVTLSLNHLGKEWLALVLRIVL